MHGRRSPTTEHAASSSPKRFLRSPRQTLLVGLLLVLTLHSLLVHRTLRRAQLAGADESGGRQLEHHRADEWRIRSNRRRLRQKKEVAGLPVTSTKEDLTVNPNPNPTTTDIQNHTAPIRSWGSSLTTTPLIFVHIGKAGGGGVRARFSAARPAFTECNWRVTDPNASYPIQMHSDRSVTTAAAYFCNSGHATFRSTKRSLYEETLVCSATTPLGAALACPDHLRALQQEPCSRNCGPEDSTCHQVYVGHNIVGAEWHWLPYKVLIQWWQTNYAHKVPAAVSHEILHRLQALEPSNVDWCPYESRGVPRPTNRSDYIDKLLPCSVPLARVSDHLAHQARLQSLLASSLAFDSRSSPPQARELAAKDASDMEDWSPFYATLPVLRTTLVREPYSWLVSKFFWMGNYHWWDMDCSDLNAATQAEPMASSNRRRLAEAPDLEQEQEDDGGSDEHDNNTGDEFSAFDGSVVLEEPEPMSERERRRKERVFPLGHRDSTIVVDGDGFGWANRYALLYIFYLCGEDCAARYEMGLGSLDQLELQAANNLRQSFAVVGLLYETETYYDMLTARVQYLDMGLHPEVEGERHETGADKDMRRCKGLFQDDLSFQEKLRQASPAVASLERLYKVAVEVNRHQLQELAATSSVDPVVRQRLQAAVSALQQ